MLGTLSRRKNFSVSCRFRLDRPQPRALEMRAQIGDMPPPNGLRRPVSVEGEYGQRWLCRPRSLLSMLRRLTVVIDAVPGR